MMNLERQETRVRNIELEIRRIKSQLQSVLEGSQLTGGAVTGPPGVTASQPLGSVTVWTNNSGSARAAGDVVVENGNRTFTTTTSANNRLVIGVVTETIANGADGRIKHNGYQSIVKVTGAVTAGDYLVSSTTAGLGVSAGATAAAGVFAIALTAAAGPGAGTVAAYVLPGNGFGSGGGGGYATITDEGNALTQRVTADFIGAYTQAWDDSAATITRVRTGYAHYDAIVDSDVATALDTRAVAAAPPPTSTTIDVAGTPWVASNWIRCRVIMTSGARIGETSVITANTTSQITFSPALTGAPAAADTFIIIPAPPVFPTLRSAINSGASSIFYRQASGEVDFTIASSAAVGFIYGDSPRDAAITVSIVVQKAGLLMQNLLFSGTTKTLELGVTGSTTVGCVFQATHTLRMTADSTSCVLCTFSGMTGAVASIVVTGQSCRIQACSFLIGSVSGGHISAATSRLSVTGCLFVGAFETGYFINGALVQSTINGNYFLFTDSVTGVLNNIASTNISGNFFDCSGSILAQTYTLLNNISRCGITSNVFNVGPVNNASQVWKWIVGGSTTGQVVSGNLFIHATVGNAAQTFVCIETNAKGSIITGNTFANSGGTGYAIALNALNNDYSFVGNSFLVSANTSFQRWKPIHNTAGLQAIGPRSIIRNNPGLPDIGNYAMQFIEDFILMNATAVAAPLVPATHQGWAQVITGPGALVTNVANARNGLITLATGGLLGSDACIYFNSNHVVVGGGDGSWQVNLPRISSIADVRIRVGFAKIADWIAMAAGGALPVAAWDYFLLEFDSAVLANWQMRWKTAAGAEVVFNSLVPAVAASTQLLMGVDRNVSNRPYAFVQGQFINPNATATGVPVAPLTPGIFIENITLAGDKQLDIDMFAWNDSRV